MLRTFLRSRVGHPICYIERSFLWRRHRCSDFSRPRRWLVCLFVWLLVRLHVFVRVCLDVVDVWSLDVLDVLKALREPLGIVMQFRKLLCAVRESRQEVLSNLVLISA